MLNPATADFTFFTGDAARSLDVSTERIRALEREGKLHPIRSLKGIRLFSRHEVERLAAERAAPGDDSRDVCLDPLHGTLKHERPGPCHRPRRL
jgi:hypothetical protein